MFFFKKRFLFIFRCVHVHAYGCQQSNESPGTRVLVGSHPMWALHTKDGSCREVILVDELSLQPKLELLILLPLLSECWDYLLRLSPERFFNTFPR